MRILMVCLGNICRSPIAQGVMEKLAEEAGLDWNIDSAGTGGWNAGSPPDQRAVETAAKYEVDISGQICRKFVKTDFESFDRIFVMDHFNLEDVLELSDNPNGRNKVHLLLGDRDVPDPFLDDSLFHPVFQMIERGCKEIIRQLGNELNK